MTEQEAHAQQATSSDTGVVVYQVEVRAEYARRLSAMAVREGATPEAMAALLLEEKLDMITPR